jgi:2-polyprenyl-3-methyl-5-hydroxy-6-metoxy-1,4-benzoquinol methylase/predicted  nucleic acid-binding Zn-ribbon protein
MVRRFPADYKRHSNLWLPKAGSSDFSYNDGDAVETRILKLVQDASDKSLFSSELRAAISDWPSLYHLAATRANLLRPFAERLMTTKVLEVGAGCGAMTRYLGELGAEVTAIEGSPRRAQIARERTSDLPNVTIVCDRVQNFSSRDKYDIVLLIGVLEYARIYLESQSDAQLSMLRQLQGLLRTDGIIVVAIENQLGLKYFAGALEDHAGKAFFGINDQYTKNSFATFGRSRLSELLTQAGLSQQAWYYPFPDYKLPTAIISEKCLDTQPTLASSLIASAVVCDAQRPTDSLFSQEMAWGVVVRNGLVEDLTNSFLVVVGRTKRSLQDIVDQKTIAWNYAASRHPAFAKEGRFVARSGKSLEVLRSRLTTIPKPSVPLNWQISREQFIHGLNWWDQLCKIVNAPGWRAVDVADWARPWVNLLSFTIKTESGISELNQTSLVDGKYFDAVPFNVIRGGDGNFYFIDQEWGIPGKVELLFLICRGVKESLSRVTSVSEPELGTPTNLNRLLKAVLAHLGILVSDIEIRRFSEFELRIQKWVLGEQDEAITPEQITARGAQALHLRNHVDRGALRAQVDQLRTDLAAARNHETELEGALKVQAAEAAAAGTRAAGLHAEVEARGAEIVRLNNEIVAAKGRLEGLGIEVERQRAELVATKTQAAEREAQLGMARSHLAQREAALAASRIEAAEREAVLAASRAQVAERNAEVAAAKARVVERDAELAATKTQVAKHQTELAATRTQVAEHQAELAAARTQVAEHQTELAAASTQVADHQTELAMASTQVAQYQADVADLRHHAEALNRELEFQRQRVDALNASTSWRLTRPLRWTAAKFPWLKEQSRRVVTHLWRR